MLRTNGSNRKLSTKKKKKRGFLRWNLLFVVAIIQCMCFICPAGTWQRWFTSRTERRWSMRWSSPQMAPTWPWAPMTDPWTSTPWPRDTKRSGSATNPPVSSLTSTGLWTASSCRPTMVLERGSSTGCPVSLQGAHWMNNYILVLVWREHHEYGKNITAASGVSWLDLLETLTARFLNQCSLNILSFNEKLSLLCKWCIFLVATFTGWCVLR